MSELTNRGPSPNKKRVQVSSEAASKAKAAQLKRQVKQPSFFDQYSYQIVIGGFVIVCFAAIVSIMTTSSKKINETPVNDEVEINAHNSRGDTYTMGRVNFFDQQMLSDARDILNVTLTTRSKLHQCSTNQVGTIIPEGYDFRQQYPNCERTLHEQGNITSAQVLASLKTASDRFCAQTNGDFTELFSAQPIITCDKQTYQKGTVSRVFDYGKKYGFVSESCFPYNKEQTEDAKCQSKLSECNDNQKSLLGYCIASTEEGIKREILQNGPVTVAIPLFRNFLNYKTGIFRVSEGAARLRAGVTLNVIGWDVTPTGQKYWIVENFWGDSWGTNGIGHIAIGIEELFIDQYALAPVPNIEANRKEMEEQNRINQQRKEKQKNSLKNNKNLFFFPPQKLEAGDDSQETNLD